MSPFLGPKIPNINSTEHYVVVPLPDWRCPKCQETGGGYEVIDNWPPVCGPIAIECEHCKHVEL